MKIKLKVKQILSSILVIILVLGQSVMPVMASNLEEESSVVVDRCTSIEGCTLELGHTGNCKGEYEGTQGEKIIITKVIPLDENIANQSYELGKVTEKEILSKLPKEIDVTTSSAITVSPAIKVSVDWKSDKVFNEELEDTYTYTSQLKDNTYILADGVSLPNITINVIETESEGVRVGDFIVVGGEKGIDYSFDNYTLTIKTGTNLTIKNINTDVSTKNNIVVQDGVTANLTLNGVNIDFSPSPNITKKSTGEENIAAFKIKGDATANITLSPNTTNILKSGANKAGIQVQDKHSQVATLNISGEGSLEVYGGSASAGIGGSGDGANGGNITINSGKIKAIGGEYAAGIGGAGGFGDGKYITINGGIVTATGGSQGAGIGGGENTTSENASGGTIIISGGKVTAVGGSEGDGIGGGKGSVLGKNLTISGGTVKAKGGSNGAGIGNIPFSTGENGNAFICASSILDKSNNSEWSGVIFQDGNGGVYGTPILKEDAEVHLNHSLNIYGGETLTIDEGITLKNNGTINNKGTIYNYGKLEGTAVTGNQAIDEVSTTKITFEKDGVEVKEVSYRDTFTIKATINKKSVSSLNRAVNQVEFWAGEIGKGINLGTSTVENNEAMIEIDLSGEKLPEGFKYGENKISVYFGGRTTEGDELLPSVAEANITVNKKQLTESMFEDIPSHKYIGREIRPTVTITEENKNIISVHDYTVQHSNNTNVGTATVIIIAEEESNYTGTVTKNFEITKSDFTMTVTPFYKEFIYGEGATFSVRIDINTETNLRNSPTKIEFFLGDKAETSLGEADVDFSSGIGLANLTKVMLPAGTHTITAVYGSNNLLGEKRATTEVTIEPKQLTEAMVEDIPSYQYTGSAIEPTVTVKDGNPSIISTNDYTVGYSNNTNSGTATVTITGKNNYTGTVTKTFEITGESGGYEPNPDYEDNTPIFNENISKFKDHTKWPEMKDVNQDKTFKITFTKDLDQTDIEDHVRVYNSYGARLSIKVKVNGNVLEVYRDNKYNSDSTYYLEIDEGIKAKDGEVFTDKIIMKFTTR